MVTALTALPAVLRRTYKCHEIAIYVDDKYLLPC